MKRRTSCSKPCNRSSRFLAFDRLSPPQLRHFQNGFATERTQQCGLAGELGPTWLLTELWETLGLSDLMRRAVRSSRRSFDVEAAVRLMVLNRLCDPESKLGVLNNVQYLQAEDIVERCKALADIERGFRVLKRDIEIAPVYHYKPDRIRAHAMIYFLALLVHRVMRMRLRQKGSRFSVERAIDKLRGIQLHQVQIGAKRLRGLTKTSAEQLGLFEALGVKKTGRRRRIVQHFPCQCIRINHLHP